MSQYTLENKRSPNQSSRQHYGYPSTPTGITIHHWGSTGQKHANVVNYLTRDNGDTSAHSVISAGRVTEMVEDTRASWHSGSTEGNGSTMGYECRPEMSAEDWRTLVEYCTDKEEKWGSLKYFKHSDWKNTACPGKYSDMIGDLVTAINAEHERRKSGGSTPTPSKPKPAPSKPKPTKPKADTLEVDGKWGKASTRALQKILGTPIDGIVSFQPAAYESDNPGLLSGWEWTKSPRSSNVIEALQEKLGVSADGRIGPNTISALQRKLGTPIDGRVSNPSAMVKALQRNLNDGKLW